MPPRRVGRRGSAAAVPRRATGVRGRGLAGPRQPVLTSRRAASSGHAGSMVPHRGARYARIVSGDQRIDPRDATFFAREDYYEVLAGLRDEDPVHECAPGFWAVTRYEDIRDLSRDPARFCSSRGVLINDPIRASGRPTPDRSIVHMDPPEHAAFRGLVNRRFTPRALSGLAESIHKSASSLLDGVAARHEIDFVAELAAPFPLSVIAELLGIDEADREDFRRWSDAAIESPDLPPDETMAALGELGGFIVEHIRAKRERPGEDLVSLLVGSEVGGCPLSREELFMFLLTLLVAGNETTRTLLSGTAIVLDEQPDQRAALVAEPDLVPGAVEECLRWVTPVHAFCRTATEEHRRGRDPCQRGRLPVHALRVGQPRRADLRGGRGALRRAATDQSGPSRLRLRRARVPGRQPGPPRGEDLPRGDAGAIPDLCRDGTRRAGALDHGGGRQVAAGGAGAGGRNEVAAVPTPSGP